LAVFLDTGLFVAVNNKSDKNHGRATLLLEKALKGEYGILFTSDYVIDEAVTTALARTHDYQIAFNTGSSIIESMSIEKAFTGPGEFLLGWQKFQKFKRKPLSFTDCVSLAHMDKRGIERIISFDSEFDGLTTRLY